MRCTNCGSDLEEGSVFCSNCGTKVEMPVVNPEMEADTPDDDIEVDFFEIEPAVKVPESPKMSMEPEASATFEMPAAPEVSEMSEMPAEPEMTVTPEISIEPVAVAEEEIDVNTDIPSAPSRLVCEKCGCEYSEGDVFCGNCGNDLRKQASDGEVVPAASTYSTSEYAEENDIHQEAEDSLEDEYGYYSQPRQKKDKPKKQKADKKKADRVKPEKPQSEKKKIPAAAIGIVAAAVVVIVLAVIFVPKLFSKENGRGYLVYFKDNGIVMRNGKNIQPMCEDVFDDDYEEYNCGSYVVFSEDGSKVFYPSDVKNGNFDLYVKNAKSKKDDGYKVESDVYSNRLLDNNRIIYTKGSMGSKLYVSDLKGNRQKVASDVDEFWKSDDGKTILYMTYKSDNYDLYCVDSKLKKPAVKIESNIDEVISYSKNFNLIYFKKNNSIYACRNFGESEKIASHVSDYYVSKNKDNDRIYIYYVVDNDKVNTISIEKFLNNDVDVLSYEKENVIERVRDEICTVHSKKLYLYTEGSEEVLLADGDFSVSYGQGGAIVYKVLTGNPDGKMKLSELMQMDYDELTYELEWAKTRASVLRVNVFGKDTTIDADFDDYTWTLRGPVLYNKDTKEIYIALLDPKDPSDKTLFKTGVGSEGTLEEVCEGFSNGLTACNGKVYYIIDADENGGDLYVDGKYVDSEVSSLVKDANEKNVFYVKDYDTSNGFYTLVSLKGDNVNKIADDVYSFTDSKNGDVAFLVDYDLDAEEGDLMLYHNKKTERIDSDVNYIMKFE